MSYILEALKRAEQERQIGQIPNAAAPAPEAYDGEKRYWPWVLLAVLLLAVAVLGLTFWLSADRSTEPGQAATPPQSQAVDAMRAKQVPADRQVSDLPTRVTAVRPEPTVVIQAAPIERTPIAEVRLPAESAAVEPVEVESQAPAATSATDTPPVSAERQPAPAPKAEPEEAPETAPEAAPMIAQTPSEEAAEAASDGADSEPADYELPWLNEMPLAFRRGVPSLEIQFHRYTDDRSRSFVMIAGQRYREGQILKSGPTLERIVEEGLILRWRGERFIYPLGG